MFDTMTAREARSINPTRDQLIAAFDYLIGLGWRPVAADRPDKPPYTYGWWTKAGHETKSRPVGDSKNLHFAAWDTLKTYVLPE